jgi:hypothetical protein
MFSQIQKRKSIRKREQRKSHEQINKWLTSSSASVGGEKPRGELWRQLDKERLSNELSLKGIFF